MSGDDLEHGVIIHLSQVAEQADGATVRVLGRIETYDAGADRAVIVLDKAKLLLDTSLLCDFGAAVGILYQFIGRLHKQPAAGAGAGSSFIHRPRVVTRVEGLDTRLFYKAVTIRNNFIQERAEQKAAAQ